MSLYRPPLPGRQRLLPLFRMYAPDGGGTSRKAVASVRGPIQHAYQEALMVTLTSFLDTPAFKRLCNLPVERLAQHVLVQRDIIRALQTKNREPEDTTYFVSRIAELEESLAEANEVIQRLIEGDPVEWEAP